MMPAERRATFGLASIFGLRMFGLFLILPVFSLHGGELQGATPMLIGLALGAYGLTQALLQIPMGWASDHWGRRPVIITGLLVFALGSVLAALSESIYGVIAGRALQGGGAIAAAVMALASDLTRDSQRTKAMAVIGMSVGGAFLAALVVGPLMAASLGLAGLFWLTALLALAALLVLWLGVPEGEARPAVRTGPGPRFREMLRDRNLWRLDLGIFVLHLILTAGFVALPLLLRDRLGLPGEAHWRVYVPVLLLSVVALVPAIGFGERRGRMHQLVPGTVLALLMALLLLALAPGAAWLWFALWLYFSAFNILEASLPSLISRFVDPSARGRALGVYSTAQFAGAFVGGLAGGLLYGLGGSSLLFLGLAALCVPWLLATLGMGRVPGRG
ncbi:MFS transporter [Alkalilimnicola sp. S0819]|nr:MFS transporter [Alkalilimnicola sp. S0819]MPQ17236.1 MFS transporter [Alkalilimnicola sp. S0819]